MSLIDELKAVGLTCSRIRDGVPDVSEEQKELANLVVAAENKEDGDPDLTALKNHLGVESDQWAAYVEARKAPISEQRQTKYRAETDPMRLKIDEDYEPGSQEWADALQEWRNAKDLIRADLPYPVEL